MEAGEWEEGEVWEESEVWAEAGWRPGEPLPTTSAGTDRLVAALESAAEEERRKERRRRALWDEVQAKVAGDGAVETLRWGLARLRLLTAQLSDHTGGLDTHDLHFLPRHWLASLRFRPDPDTIPSPVLGDSVLVIPLDAADLSLALCPRGVVVGVEGEVDSWGEGRTWIVREGDDPEHGQLFRLPDWGLALDVQPDWYLAEGIRVIADLSTTPFRKGEAARRVGRLAGTVVEGMSAANGERVLVLFDEGVYAYVGQPDLRPLLYQGFRDRRFGYDAHRRISRDVPRYRPVLLFLQWYVALFPRRYLLDTSDGPQSLVKTRHFLLVGQEWKVATIVKVDHHLAMVSYPVEPRDGQKTWMREWVYIGSDRFNKIALRMRDLPYEAVELDYELEARHRAVPVPNGIVFHNPAPSPGPRFRPPAHSATDGSGSAAAFDPVGSQSETKTFARRQMAKKTIARPKRMPEPSLPVAEPFEIVLDEPESQAESWTAVGGEDATEAEDAEERPWPDGERVRREPPPSLAALDLTGAHLCGPSCSAGEEAALAWWTAERAADRAHSPLLLPIVAGWTRKFVRGNVHYRAPCGVDVKKPASLDKQLWVVESRLPLYAFSFAKKVEPLARWTLKLEALWAEDAYDRGRERSAVSAVNSLTREGPPALEYEAVREWVGEEGWAEELSRASCSGCACEDGCRSEACACRRLSAEGREEVGDLSRGYAHQRLEFQSKPPLFECNDHCACRSQSHLCRNRVVQHGLAFPLQLFKTPAKGWGVRALVDIPKGSFIVTYVGKVLKDQDAERAAAISGDVYLMDMDALQLLEREKLGEEEGGVLGFLGDPEPYVLDAVERGNVGRYFNHGCRPNAFVQAVAVESHDLRRAHVALFASAHVPAGHEIVWHYGYEVGSVPGKAIHCLCQASNCQGRIL